MKDDRLKLYFTISEIAGIFAVAIGLFVLAGWTLDAPFMKSVLPGLVTMKANTAVCFILIGTALWSLQVKRIDKKPFRALGMICSFLVALTGALTLFEYLSGNNLGIDQLLFKEPAGAAFTIYPGRMALNTAVNFFMIGEALILLNVKIKLFSYLSQLLAVASGFIALIALYGYFYGVSAFSGKISAYTVMALHTTIAFIFLSLGILFARPDKGFSAVITDPRAGGIIIRRLLFVIIMIPSLSGWLKLYWEKAGLFNSQFGTAVMVAFNVALLSIILLWTAAIINRAEEKNKIAQIRLDTSNEEWKITFDAMSDPTFIIDMENTITNVNTALAKFLGKRPDEIIGKKCYEIMHGAEAPIVNCPMGNTRRDGKSHTEEVNDPYIGIPLLVTTSPIFDKDHRMIGAVHAAKDISSVKKTEEALSNNRKELQTLLDSVPAMIFYKDAANIFVRTNKIFEDTLQLPKAKIEGKRAFDIYPRDLAEGYLKDDLEVMASGQPKRNIIETMETPRGRIWVRTDKVPYRDGTGKIIGVIGFSIDITESKLAQDALAKKMRDLEVFYKAAIDREMKIKELKKRLDQLEGREKN